MAITTFSSRTFARDAGAVKRATANGPVFITDRCYLGNAWFGLWCSSAPDWQ